MRRRCGTWLAVAALLWLSAGVQAAPCPPGGIDLRAMGAIGDGASHPVTAPDLAALPEGRGARYAPGDQRDAVALGEALFAAGRSAAKVVCIPAGRYLLDRALPPGWGAAERMALAERLFLDPGEVEAAAVWFDTPGGLTLLGDAGATLTTSAADPRIWVIAPPAARGAVRLEDLRFDRLGLAFSGDPGGRRLGPVTLRGLAFLGGPGHQLQLLRVADATLEDSRFARDREERGRSLLIWKSHRVLVEGNRFEGFIATAVNVSGTERRDAGNLFGPFDPDERSREIAIRGNLLARDPAARYQDHGIYVWGADGVVIADNQISGWESSRFGTEGARYSGAIKARNGENYVITGNRIRDTGILLYAYDSPFMPRYLRHVLVADNDIAVADGWFDHCQYKGIVYWKNFEPEPGAVYERDIVIRDNRVAGGCIQINGARADLSAVTLVGNLATDFRFYLPGRGWRGLAAARAAGVFARAHGNRLLR